jgi:hypothetical protein
MKRIRPSRNRGSSVDDPRSVVEETRFLVEDPRSVVEETRFLRR